MDASHPRLGSAADWTVAVLFLIATVGVGGLIIHEFTTLRAPSQAPMVAPAPAVRPVALPPLSMPVSALPLPTGETLRLGDSLSRVEKILGMEATTSADLVEQARLGRRITRTYEYANIHFTLVFEPFERNGDLRIVGMYLR